MTRDELLRDLDIATQSGDLELARAIAAKLDATDAGSAVPKAATSITTAPKLTDAPGNAAARNPLTRFAVGAGEGLLGTAQLVNKVALQGTPDLQKMTTRGLDWVGEQVARTKEMGQPEGANIAGIAGNVLSPVGLKAASVMPKVVGPGAKIAQNTIFGTTLGATAPTYGDDQDKQRGVNAAVGGVVGGTVSAAGSVLGFLGRPVVEFVRYILPGKGAERLATRYANEIIGPDNVAKIVAEVDSFLKAGPPKNVPGYEKTTGEVVAHMPEATGVQAIQRATAQRPGIAPKFALREAEQQGAVKNALGQIAQTPAVLKKAVDDAQANAAVNYGAVAAKKVKLGREVEDLMDTPAMRQAVADAKVMTSNRMKELWPEEGQPLSVQQLHDIKVALDKQIANGSAPSVTGQPALDKTSLKILGDLRSQYLTWLEKKVPDYAAARQQFAKDMVPANQMQVAQALEKRLTGPTDQMTPGSYLRAIDEETKTVKNALGQSRSDFGKVFDPKQRATIDEIGGLLESKALARTPLQRTSLGGALDEGARIDLPHMLSTPIVFANYVIKTLTRGAGGLEERVAQVNALRMLNPEAFANAMRVMPPSEASKVMQALAKQGVTPSKTGAIAPTAYGLFNFNSE
jgi:hypothetical protein